MLFRSPQSFTVYFTLFSVFTNGARSIWENSLPDKPQVDSYLLNDPLTKDLPFVRLIKDVMEVIHAKQHPPKEQCRTKRLQLVQQSTQSFEGTGSILKQTMLTLASAVHADRVLIWGFGYPHIFDKSKELWDSEGNDRLEVNDDVLDCSDSDPLSGPYACFFQPISSCTLEDVSLDEMQELALNGWNETGRARVSETRQGISMYHAPEGLLEYILDQRKDEYTIDRSKLKEIGSHVFAAAVAAYGFRLKPDLVSTFMKRNEFMFKDRSSPNWGLHVRHGDLKALTNVYKYREVFEFEHYFAKARELSHILAESPGGLFVATDSVEADQVPQLFEEFMRGDVDDDSDVEEDDDDDSEEDSDEEEEDDAEEEDEEYSFDLDDDEDDSENDEYEDELEFENIPWFEEKVPKIYTILNKNRYRTEHGSHTVAANGGCRPSKTEGVQCALNYEDIIVYQGMDEHKPETRAYRIMRVLAESIEDIFLLSNCDVLIAQGSSHFSTLAGLLVFARTGAVEQLQRVHYLDHKLIEAGLSPTAYLHGMNQLNGTLGYSSPDAGRERWFKLTRQFFSGSLEAAAEYDPSKLKFDPWAPDMIMSIVRGLPRLPEELFQAEARVWRERKYKPSLPGHCPRPKKKSEDAVSYAAVLINMGVSHIDYTHHSQAVRCWMRAVDVLLESGNKSQLAANALDVARGNLGTQIRQEYYKIWAESKKQGYHPPSVGQTEDEYYDDEEEEAEDEYDDGEEGEGDDDDEYDEEEEEEVEKEEVFRPKQKSIPPIKTQKEGNPKATGVNKDSLFDEPDGLKSLEDYNEEIIKIELRLKKLKEGRDKLLKATQMFYAGNLKAQ